MNGGFSIARLLRGSAWAPAAVLVLAWCLGRTRVAHEFWWVLHILGGGALAFFFLRALEAAHPFARYIGAFALACTGALGWEVAEYMIDEVFGTALQEGLVDTMSDLLLGICGAAGTLAFGALFGGERKARNQSAR